VGSAPLLAAVVIVRRRYPPQERRRFWRRMWDSRLVGWRWWPVVVLAGAGPTFVGWLVAGSGEAGISSGPASVGMAAWLVFAAGAAVVEEPGWRGYALDALSRRLRLDRAALVLGLAWAAWHLPQFLLEGTYQQGLGIGSGQFWVFLAGIVAQTFLYVWVVAGTGGSILAAIVFHALTNLAGELLDPTFVGELVALSLWVVAALALVVHWRRSGKKGSA
jgi:uncharacterized protein